MTSFLVQIFQQFFAVPLAGIRFCKQLAASRDLDHHRFDNKEVVSLQREVAMWRTLGIAITLQAGAAVAQSSEGPKLDETGKYAGNYLCAPLASGGVRWDETTNEWRGTAFKVPPDGQFVFEIKVADKRMEWEAFGWPMAGTTYHAIMRPLEGNVVSCWGEREGYQPAELVGYGHILMSQDGKFRCQTRGGLNYYDFNLSNRRYQRTYHAGFIDGEDSGEDTPSVEIGKCTRMD